MQLGDLTGRTCLVTGANSGIGYESVRGFARNGAHVVLACRDTARAEHAISRLRAELPSARLSVLPIDLSNLDAIRAAAQQFNAAHEKLDVLCNNAGVMALPRTLTRDGFEIHRGVNHLGHFALTGLLLDRLLRSGPGRIVTVTSITHRFTRMRFDDLDAERQHRTAQAYAQSKLANLLFAYELQRKLAARGAQLISVACHPGYARTNLLFADRAGADSRLRTVLYKTGNALLAQSAENAARAILYAATAPGVRGGECIGPRGLFELWGTPSLVATSEQSHDIHDARKLWEVSVEATGVGYDALG